MDTQVIMNMVWAVYFTMMGICLSVWFLSNVAIAYERARLAVLMNLNTDKGREFALLCCRWFGTTRVLLWGPEEYRQLLRDALREGRKRPSRQEKIAAKVDGMLASAQVRRRANEYYSDRKSK
jgi:hypothetical protein